MKRILAGAVLCIVLVAQPSMAQQATAPTSAPVAHAADPAHLAAARRVIAANGTEASEHAVIAQLTPMVMAQIGHAQGLSDAQIATARDVLTEEMESSVGDLVEIVVQIYANHFTTEQLNALADFYESPAGHAYIAEMPALLHDSIAVSQQWAQTTLEPRVAARMAAITAQQQQQMRP